MRGDGAPVSYTHLDVYKRQQVERELAAAYGLKDVFVVPSVPDGDLNETIAKAAAMYISGRLTDNCFINMGYGDTPSRVLNNLATMTERPISCVSLTGGVNYYLPNTRSNIFNIKLYLIPAPLLASTKEMVAAMRNEESVMEISRMVKLSSMTVVGIGGMQDDATILRSNILTKNDFLYLETVSYTHLDVYKRQTMGTGQAATISSKFSQ